jgi:hypothetical protein
MQDSDEPAPNPTVVLQRVRNGIIEYLELASSFEAQLAYQGRVPHISVPNEVINQWQDWVTKPPFDDFPDPTFSVNERAAMTDYHATWNAVADITPDPLPPLSEVVRLPHWHRLRDAASVALGVFMTRGKLSEEHEHPL